MVSELTIQIERVKQSKIDTIDFNHIPFGRFFSDHMLHIQYKNGAWQQAKIQPYQNLSISPACSTLHYGQAAFEGMKGHYDEQTGETLLFRPEENAKRINRSATRLGMPTIPEEVFLEGLAELVRLDRQWVPKNGNSSLYIRPTIFANDPFIGVRSAENYDFFIITGPVGAYYNKPVKVWIQDQYARAFSGGTGDVKASGNYAPTLYPAQLAKEAGYDQILWTDCHEFKYAQEIGTMNFFCIIDGVVITPSLDGAILPGVTRASVIQLFKDAGVVVEERKISIAEIVDAHKTGRLQDAFGTGTAATISYISDIGYKGNNYTLLPIEERTLSAKIGKQLDAIKRGLAPDPYGWIVRV